MEPIIKYSGSKRKELPHILPHIPYHLRYIEPFFGGGAVYFGLMPREAVIADIQPDLIRFYTEIKTNCEKVMSELKELQTLFDRNQVEYETAVKNAGGNHKEVTNANDVLYYEMRDMVNEIKPLKYTFATCFFFVNKTCTMGTMRRNGKGKLNCAFGCYGTFGISSLDIRHAELLQWADIRCQDFEETIKMAREGDFMFLDPPYSTDNDAERKMWNKYTGVGFDYQERLSVLLHSTPAKWLMVVHKTPLMEKLYEGLIRSEYGKEYNISKAFKSEPVRHIVIANYELGKEPEPSPFRRTGLFD